MNKIIRVVFDTNVLVAALRSRTGASNYLVGLLSDETWELQLSQAVVLEYEEILKSFTADFYLSDVEIDEFIDILCYYARLHPKRYFSWRPISSDADDDIIIELAIQSGADVIVTFNKRDLRAAEQFGINLLTPSEFIRFLEQ